MLLLHVRDATLQAHGAVSAETAAEMAVGVRRLLGSDIGLSTTGVAGPGGGTPEKPVGTVYVHLSAPDAEWGEHHIWPYDRSGNKLASVQALLDLTRRYLDQWFQADQRPNRPQQLNLPVIVEASNSASWWKPTVVWIQDQRWDIVGWGRQSEQADGSTVMMVEAGSAVIAVRDSNLLWTWFRANGDCYVHGGRGSPHSPRDVEPTNVYGVEFSGQRSPK